MQIENISNNSKKANSIANIFLLFVLFFPVNYFYAYHFIILIPLGAYLIKNKAKWNNSVKLLLLFLAYWIVGTAVRFVFYGDNLRDIFEIFRFIPLLLFLMHKDEFKRVGKFSFIIICTYLLFNCYISTLQFLYKDSSPMVVLIGHIYNSELHFNESLLLNSRALGLSMGPSSNAIIVLLCMIFVWFKFITLNKFDVALKYSALLAGVSTILLTQSQTGFITLGVIVGYLILLNFIRKPLLTSFILGGVILPGFLMLSSSNLISDFGQKNGGLYYLSTLFDQGTERGSYQLRVEKRNEMVSKAINSPGFMMIGWGKDYFGDDTSATDNEHLYIALVYGPLVWIVFMLACFYFGVKYSFLFLKYGKNKYLFAPVLTLCWVVFAIPASFITYPASLILSVFFLNYDDE
ncbi:hypothetical protein [Kluyvera ascorbata]